MTVADLAAFISARLSEDEAMARRNIGAGLNDTATRGLLPGYPDYRTYDGPDIAAADDYITHFRPLRVLREVAAKRAIVARYGEPLAGLGLGEQLQLSQEKQGLYFAVRALAAVWSDHPDYRAEWAPGHG